MFFKYGYNDLQLLICTPCTGQGIGAAPKASRAKRVDEPRLDGEQRKARFLRSKNGPNNFHQFLILFFHVRNHQLWKHFGIADRLFFNLYSFCVKA